MADLGNLPTKNSMKGFARVIFPLLTMRNTNRTTKGAVAGSWAGHTGHTVYKKLPHVVRQTPAWWGTLPPGSTPILPDYELRGQVQQNGTPLPNVRVALFFRRTNWLVDVKVSDSFGNVHFPNIMPGSQAYYAIAFDLEGSPMQNAIIWDRLTSVPAT